MPLMPQLAMPIASVIEHVAFEVGTQAEAIAGTSRRWRDARGRVAAVWLARETGRHRMKAIGAAIGRSHWSAYKLHREAEILRLTDADFRFLTDALADLLPRAAANNDF